MKKNRIIHISSLILVALIGPQFNQSKREPKKLNTSDVKVQTLPMSDSSLAKKAHPLTDHQKYSQAQDMLSWVQNPKNDILKRVEKLSQFKIVENEIDRTQLTAFIMSENPYSHSKRSPHTNNELIFREEASLRVHALKILSKNLNNQTVKQELEHIISDAKDPTIRRIAQKIVEYHHKGRSFFNDMTNGIHTLSL